MASKKHSKTDTRKQIRDLTPDKKKDVKGGKPSISEIVITKPTDSSS